MKTMTHKGMKRRCYADGGIVEVLRNAPTRTERALREIDTPAPAARPIAPAAAPVQLGIKAPTTAAVSASRQNALNARLVQRLSEAQARGDSQTWTQIHDALGNPKEYTFAPPRTPYAAGGKVPGRGNRDTVPAMLTPGEFVMRKAAVQAHGVDKLQAMNRAGLRRRN